MAVRPLGEGQWPVFLRTCADFTSAGIEDVAIRIHAMTLARMSGSTQIKFSGSIDSLGCGHAAKQDTEWE